MKCFAGKRKNKLNVWKNVRSGVGYNPSRLCGMIMAELNFGGYLQ